LVLTEKINPGSLTVYELIALGRHPYTDWTGSLSKTDQNKVEWAITETGTNYLTSKKISELSDGQLQKVMIARALAQDGQIIILDEPTAHLDLNNKVEIMTLLKSLAEQTGKAILMATHELDLTIQVADKLWLTNFGKPLKTGIPEDLVLQGALQDTYYREGFDFDIATGKIMLTKKLSQSVNLKGTGPALIWTQRALERKGFQVDPAIAEPGVQIVEENSGFTWICQNQSQSKRFSNIESMLHHLASL